VHPIIKISDGGKIMTFYEYMKQNYYEKEGRKADLANDMVSDEADFPVGAGTKDRDGHGMIRRYLESCLACDDCLEVFEECWKEYKACEKSRSSSAS
jgi:uncharacterized protein YozE (UPF0346 family)